MHTVSPGRLPRHVAGLLLVRPSPVRTGTRGPFGAEPATPRTDWGEGHEAGRRFRAGPLTGRAHRAAPGVAVRAASAGADARDAAQREALRVHWADVADGVADLASVCPIKSRSEAAQKVFSLWPPGLALRTEIFSMEEESSCLAAILARPWVKSQSGRKKQDFGPKVNFKKRTAKPGGFSGFPAYSSRTVIPRLQSAFPVLTPWWPHEQVALEYRPSEGANMALHIDDTWVWGDRIAGVCLQAEAWMLFCPPDDGETPPVAVEVLMPRRAGYVLSGTVRNRWLHGIQLGRVGSAREQKENVARVSLTYRELAPELLASPSGKQLAQLAR